MRVSMEPSAHKEVSMSMMPPATTKRNQYDSVFRMLFHKPEALLELYDAVSGSLHTDTTGLEINTLSDAIYITMHNDVSFVMDFQIHLYEHQSTVNPNMPLRDLLYIAQLYTKRLDTTQLYSNRPVELPFPVFLVFYNGREEVPEQMDHYLSELYPPISLPANLDLRVRVLNINPGYNEELVAASPYLWGYQIYTDKVRRYSQMMPLQQAMERAVTECIEEGILKEFLLENKKEVMDMSIFEFDQQMYIKVQTDEAREDGIQIGLEKGREQGEHRMESLVQYLLSKRCYDELERATSDKAYRQLLYQQYGIA